ncbi:hypothetical protein K491DRAFT_499655 [Lophiostoma macrostomum CBS 122681]|uniref:Uncharacterized protein n=1 Tax=Lophiostoma macrostomum CBS 122681 TaxID=1314788 RepID=A0A6A6T212_9PLEO|nr:hypothetical protein K491DRAFT_499655 [Lophiostoma macrostomum CBS 122681]
MLLLDRGYIISIPVTALLWKPSLYHGQTEPVHNSTRRETVFEKPTIRTLLLLPPYLKHSQPIVRPVLPLRTTPCHSMRQLLAQHTNAGPPRVTTASFGASALYARWRRRSGGLHNTNERPALRVLCSQSCSPITRQKHGEVAVHGAVKSKKEAPSSV